MKYTTSLVVIILPLLAIIFTAGCATTPDSPYKHVVLASGGQGKFRLSDPVEQGASYSWNGFADAEGFATGRGTRTYYNPDGVKVFEYDANFINGVSTTGPYEERQYDGKTLVSRQIGQKDSSGNTDGRCEWVYFDAVSNDDLIRKYANFRNGVKSGRTETFEKGGGRNVFDYVDGTLDDTYSVYADGTIRRNVIFDRQKQLKQTVAEYHARQAEEREAQRASSNSAMIGALTSGLSGLTADMNSSTAGRSSSHGSGTDSTGNSGGGYSGGGSPGGSSPALPRITLSAYGTEVSDTVQDSRGKSHESSVDWGKGKEYATKGQAKAEANRRTSELVRRSNEYYAKDDQRKAEEKRRAAEQEEKARQYREAQPKYKGIIPR